MDCYVRLGKSKWHCAYRYTMHSPTRVYVMAGAPKLVWRMLLAHIQRSLHVGYWFATPVWSAVCVMPGGLAASCNPVRDHAFH